MNIDGIASLRQLLADMERDIGIHELPGAQRDVLYAATLLANQKKPITVANLNQHPLISSMARATFFRCLKSLSEQGYLIAGSKRSDGYTLASNT